MDSSVLELLEEFEIKIKRSFLIPLIGRRIIKEGEILNFIANLKGSFPKEFERAKLIVQERERILEDAKKEVERIIENAKKEKLKLIEESSILEEADKKRAEVLLQTKREQEAIEKELNEYAIGLLGKLEENVLKALESIKLSKRSFTVKQPPDSFEEKK